MKIYGGKKFRYDPEKGKAVPAEELEYAEYLRKRGPEVQSLGRNGDTSLTSFVLPLNWKYAPQHDKEGRCHFRNMGEIREAVARANDDGERVGYSRGMHNYE